jgi:predicted ATP-dependent Lon-type protease
MDDFTKNKLINSLIDVVEKFYELKNNNDTQDAKHLKGFCEGMAYTLIELQYLSQAEASKILKGLGKRMKVEEKADDESLIYQPQQQGDDLDIPTFLRKK